MAKDRDREAGRASEGGVTPSRFPDTTPPLYPSPNYDFVMQGIWEINRTIGALQNAVENLTKLTKDHDDKIDKLSHRVYAATTVIAVLWAIGLAILGYFHK